MRDCTKFVELDVHKSMIAVAIAVGDRMPPVSYGLIENTPEANTRLIKKLLEWNCVRFCYEAGPCGHEFTYRSPRLDTSATSLPLR